MQHVARPFLRRKVKQAVGWGASDRVRNYELYPHRLQFYEMPPNEEVSLEEFETLAIERLKVLKAIETAKVRWPKRGNDFDTFVRTAIKQHLPFTIRADEDTAFDERRRDHISHFVLRLAYCKSEDLRRWFLLHEAELFRFRFEQERIEEANLFLKTNDLKYKPVSIEKKQVLAPKLARVGFNLTEESVKGAEYFEVPFEDALELVRSRRVFIEQGRAY
eukprot:UC1_evm1s683